MTANTLPVMLQLAVPQRILEIQEHGGVTDEDMARVQGYQEDLGSHGDDLLFLNTKSHATATRFNQVVDILAVLAFVPGGVTAFGLHFEEKVKNGRDNNAEGAQAPHEV